MVRKDVGDKALVREKYPFAKCRRTGGLYFVYLGKSLPRNAFSQGRTAAQAWRRAYERMIANGK